MPTILRVGPYRVAQATKVRVVAEELIVDSVDGRTVTVPVQWYPRLSNGTPAERRNWRLIGRGEGIHWPDLDEDITVDDLLAGRPSGESRTSLQRCLKARGLLPNTRVQRLRRKPTVRGRTGRARG